MYNMNNSRTSNWTFLPNFYGFFMYMKAHFCYILYVFLHNLFPFIPIDVLLRMTNIYNVILLFLLFLFINTGVLCSLKSHAYVTF